MPTTRITAQTTLAMLPPGDPEFGCLVREIARTIEVKGPGAAAVLCERRAKTIDMMIAELEKFEFFAGHTGGLADWSYWLRRRAASLRLAIA